MSITINPGTEPMDNATQANATANMDVFTSSLNGAGIPVAEWARHAENDYGEGRYAYTVKTLDGRTIEIQMPGLPIEKVQYLDVPDQDIWDFPPLYVDGSSWVWMFALRACEPDEAEKHDDYDNTPDSAASADDPADQT